MKREQGFSLAELLVALAITAVLLVLLANVVSATLSAWQQGRTRLDTFADARQLISRIGDEMGAAVASKSQMEFVENSDVAGTVNPTARTSENVFFVAPYPNAGAGDLCVIAYRHDAATRRLERAFKNSEEAWSDAAPASRYKAAGYSGAGTSGMQWRTVADGVIEFEIRSYSQKNLDDGDEYYDVDKPIIDAWNSATTGSPMEGKTPRRVVIRLKMVDDRTSARLSPMTPNTAPYNATIQASAREFIADFSLTSR